MSSHARKLRRAARLAIEQGKPCPCCGAVPVRMDGAAGSLVGHAEDCPTLGAWTPEDIAANAIEVRE